MTVITASCPSDQLAQVAIRDASLRTVAVATRAVEVDLPPGLYEVVAMAGERHARRLVRVEGEADGQPAVTLDLPKYASAAPTARSVTWLPADVEILDRTMIGLGRPAGAGGLVVMARHLGQRASGRVSDLSVAPPGRSPRRVEWGAASGDGTLCLGMPLEPGSYGLGSRAADEIAVPVWAGWQTLVFVPVVDGHPVVAGAALHCLPLGSAWSALQGLADLTEQLTSALVERGDATTIGVERLARELAGAAGPDVGLPPLQGLVLAHLALSADGSVGDGEVGGVLEAVSRHDPDWTIAPSDLAALRIRWSGVEGVGPRDIPVSARGMPPLLGASADALMRFEARHPFTLEGPLAAALAGRLASTLVFRWQRWSTELPPPRHPDAWRDAVTGFVHAAPGADVLHRVAGGGRLNPAGQRFISHVADRAHARREHPGAVVLHAHLGELVLTTGLPATALLAGLHDATVGIRRWRRRRRFGRAVAAVAAVAALAGMAWWLWPDGDGGQRDGTSTTVDEETTDGTTTATDATSTTVEPPGPRAVADQADTAAGTAIEIDLVANDELDGPVRVVITEPPTSGRAAIVGNGSARYTPAPGFHGIDRFTYQLMDDRGSSEASVVVRVLPTVLIDDLSTPEPPNGTTELTFTVKLSGSFAEPVTIRYTTEPGTASPGEDYEPAEGQLTFEPGETVGSITVVILGGGGNESAEETFTVDLSDPTNAFVDGTFGEGTGTIEDGQGGVD